MTQMSQVDLLNEYATRRDAEAFAKLVDQYQRLIFSTCRRKLHNSQDVDDAVQETFLRLAHKAGELHSNIGGWLHRCAVNVSVDMNRRRSARQKYERAAAAEQPVGLENVQVELAELREHLDAALEKLDPEQRELIIQRFFVGRPQVEMAEEAGVSPSTMTRRIESAIVAMREHLQSMAVGKVAALGAPAAIAAALQAETASAAVPAALTANIMKIGLSGTGASAGAGGAAGAAGGGAAATAATTTGAVVGSAILTKGLIGLAAVLVVAAGTIVAIVKPFSSSPQAAAPATQPQAIADVAVTVAAPPNAQSPVPPVWTTTQVAADSSALEGVIRDGDGNPVVGAEVTLQGSTYETTKTDQNGRYAFATVRAAGEHRIGVKAPGFVELDPYAGRQASLHLTPQAKARRDIVIQRGVKVTVHVKDVTGEGMRGVAIDATLSSGDNYRNRIAERVNTDELGRANVTLPVSGNTIVIAASKDEFEPKHALVTPQSVDKPQEIEMVLLPGVPVRGVAICNDGKPAAGWEVSARPTWWTSNYIPKSAPIDEQGNFTLTNVGSGKYDLTVWRKSKDGSGSSVATASYTFPASKQPIRVDVPHPSPASMVTLSGKVKFVGGPAESISITAMSTEGGWFHSRVVPAREAAVRVARPAPRRATGPATRAATRPAPAPRPPNDEGTFSFEGITPGTYRISFESTTIEPVVLENIKVPGGALPPVIELRVAGKPKLTGTVVDAVTNKPVTHFAVRVNKTETIGKGPNYVQDARWIQVSNPGGKFEVELVGPGVYQAQVSLDGYAWAWSPTVRVEKPGGSGSVQIKVTKGGSLSGQVVDAAGKPVAGAKVIAFSMSKAIGMRMEGRFEGDAGAVTTDADGRFKLEHLAAGDEKLKVVSGAHAPRVVDNLKIAEGRETAVPAIKLTDGGAVEGVVYDEKGKPQAGVTLEFQDSSGYGGQDDEMAGRLATATSDANGKYRVEHLRAGEIVYVNVGDRWQRQGVARRVVRPVEGKTAKLDFGGPTPVTGRLLSAKREPIARARIELSVRSPHFGAVMAVTQTDDDGRFAFAGPPPGRYQLYYMLPTERRTDWTKVRDVEVTGALLDLGDVASETGDVTINVTAEDPADLKSLAHMSVTTDEPNRPYQETIARAVADGKGANTWRARDIPAGKFRVQAYLGEDRSAFSARGERKAGASETAATLHIPAATATLNVTRAGGPLETAAALLSTADARVNALMGVQNEDETVQASVVFRTAGLQTLKLPPGTYRVLHPMTMKPREDIPPIVLKPGEVRSFTYVPPATGPEAKPDHGAKLTAQICYWTADGVLVTDGKSSLLDAGGKPQDSAGYGGVGPLYSVTPGTYKAILERPRKPPHAKEISIGVAGVGGMDETGGSRWWPVHIVLD